METQLDVRRKEELISAMNKADVIVQKKYLAQLVDYDVIPVPESIQKTELNKIARFYKLEQFVFDKTENTRDKLVSVFQSVAAVGASLVVLINSSGTEIDYYIGVRSMKKNPAEAHEVLYKSLCANFPGISFKRYTDAECILPKSDIERIAEDVFTVNKLNAAQHKSIASVTGIAGLRAEKETEGQKFIQGIEKVIEAMRGERYSLLLIAEPIPTSEVQTIKRGYENLYSAIKPFENTVLTYGENESESVTATCSYGITDTINHSITNTITQTEGKNYSTTHTESDTKGFSVGAGLGLIFPPVAGFVNVGFNKSHTSGISFTEGTSSSKSNAYGTTKGTSKSSSETTSDGTTKGSGSSRTLQISFENKAIKKMMDTIDSQLDRIDTAGSVGMWSCAAYCIADTPVVSEMAAAAYYSVIRGEDSYLETGAIIQWSGSNLVRAAEYLKKMLHPIVKVNDSEMPVASFISTKELAIHAGLPEKSVAGLPVKTVASFGREVVSSVQNNGINFKLGTVYHMGKAETKTVSLNKNSLASHTFITGSTGSGKSNTIYQILKEADNYECRFLVIEPAKGEYKHILGMQDGVSVYGTNPSMTPLLRINPFSFPHGNKDHTKNIHILEHLDRLVEIFNVCWPMYAAMPAVLKEAIERSYQDAGWDLTESKNPYGDNLYPSFADVARNVRSIMDSSDYDAENKGAYKGALITRLKSLTNGLNGLIFTNDALPDAELFDKNVIVDLSRVGSTETKSLIMGLLVMQLQEYRMTSGRLNSDLMHITVLEEAHNVLKRTSTEQSNESANLLGKSVEMLGNAIAEMRTYGEGFIIADQSPGLLDMAVIRNTNTKIIMRLPDLSDRELVGKAAGLNDDQIIELSKLPLGVAAMYQNDWIEPVLCKVAHHPTAGQHYEYAKPLEQKQPQIYPERLSIARFLCNPDSISTAEKTQLNEIIQHLNIRASAIVQLQQYICEPPKSPRVITIAPGISALFPEIKQVFTESFSRTDDGEQWSRDVDEAIQRILHLNTEEQLSKDIRQCIITDYLHNELGKTALLEKWAKKGGVS